MDNREMEGTTRVHEELNPSYVLATLKKIEARVRRLEGLHRAEGEVEVSIEKVERPAPVAPVDGKGPKPF